MNTFLREVRKNFVKLQLLTKADVDEWWSGYAFTILPVAGSLFSVLAALAAIWAAISLVLARFRLDVPKAALPLVFVCQTLAAWALFTGMYHDGPDGLWRGFLFAAPLISLPLFISRSRASDPARSFRAMAFFANYGLALALLLAIFQYFLNQPIEGGTGNSYVFGFVVISLLTISTPIICNRFLFERTIVISSIAALLFLADARIHVAYLTVYTSVFLFLNLNIGRFYKYLFTSIFTILFIVIFRSTFLSMISEILTVADDGLPSSFGVRFELWKAGLSIVQDFPVLGIGFESKMPEVIKLLPEHLSYIRFTHLHNMFIDAAVAMGAPALFLISGVFIAAFFMVSALEDDKRRRGYAFLALCVVHGSLGPLFTHDIAASVFIVVLAIFGSCLPPKSAHSD